MTNPLEKIRSFFSRISSSVIKIGYWIVEPHPTVKDVGGRRKAQLTSGLSLALGFTSAVGLFAALKMPDNNIVTFRPQFNSFIIGTTLSFLSYFLSRTRFPQLGSIGLVITYLFSGFYLAFFGSSNPAFSLLTTVPLSFIFASVLFPRLGTVLLTVLVTIMAFMVPHYNPAGIGRETSAAAGQFLTWGILFLIVNASRNAIERDRLGESQKLNLELQILQSSLEERIQERTKELNLASELGQILSQVRSLDSLLFQAVGLIQERFNLYYVQIYLVDAQSLVLILQAGSGRVGELLKQRGHRLTIDLTSLNGRAAFEKKPVIVSDTASASSFRPNVLLPDTHSEMCIPLIIGDRVIGVLDIQSNMPGELSQTQLPAYSSLAGQLAIAIDNANLFKQSLDSNSAIAAQASRSTKEGWSDFLNAIDEKEEISASYIPVNPQDTTRPTGQDQDINVIEIPIKFTGVSIGAIQMHYRKDLKLRPENFEFAENVAEQVARQVENLRLLSQAERYRLKAEATLRQSTRQGWQTFLDENYASELVVVYDHNQVLPVDASRVIMDEKAVIERIKVQDEVIGELVVTGVDSINSETQELLSNVTERLGTHLEYLRLTDQTKKALALSEQQTASLSLLNILATQLSSAGSIKEVFRVSGLHTRGILNSEHSSIAMITSEPNQIEVYTTTDSEKSLPVFERIPLVESFHNEIITQNRMAFLPEDGPVSDSQFMDVKKAAALGIQTIMGAPLTVSGHIVGSINTGTKRPIFTENERNVFNQVVLLVNNALENRNLLEHTQSLAQRERSLRQITSRVRSYTDPEAILRTAARELGITFGRKILIQLGNLHQNNSIQGWQGFQEMAHMPTYFYNGTSVVSITESEAATLLSEKNGKNTFLTTPLALRESESIGLLAVSNEAAKPISEDDMIFIEQINEQVSLALESARLFTQTQRALAETDSLYTIISEVSTARDYRSILAVLAQRTILSNADQSLVMFLFDHSLSKENIPEWIIPIAQHSTVNIHLAERYPLSAFEVTPNTLFTTAPILLENVLEDGRLDRITRTLFLEIFHAKSSIIIPLLLGNQSLGFILGNFGEIRTFGDAEVQRLSTIASQVAVAVQGMQLLEQTLTRARREQLLREVTNQVNNASGTDAILRRAAEQVGKVLKRPVYVYLGSNPVRDAERPEEYHA